MFQVRRTGDDSAEIVMGTWLVSGAALFFLLLGALDVVAGLFTAHPTRLLGPGLAGAVVGLVYGFIPYRVGVKVDRGLGELTRSSRALFSRSEVSEQLAELEYLAIETGTYRWYFNVMRKNGSSFPLFSKLKTWTFSNAPPPAIVARAKEIAGAIGIPLNPRA